MKRLVLTSMVLVTAFSSAAIQAQSVLLGLGRAKDGDTLMVGQSEVRLFRIDAPEFDQTCSSNGQTWSCGAAAADALMELVTGRDIQCSPMGKDQYGRVLGRCSVAGTDINRRMVELGYATAYRRYSTDYVSAEGRAKANRLGIWSGSFEAPEHYRHGGSTAQPQARSKRTGLKAAASNRAHRTEASCSIKGNRNRRGQWIYHLPGMPYYDQTRPEEIFCTEAEAQAAGYRRAVVR